MSDTRNSSSQSALDWIVFNTQARLTITDCGEFPTPEGKVVFLDPLAHPPSPNFVDVPKKSSRLVVLHDEDQGRNSKLVLIFNDNAIASGADVGTCPVSTGLASVFTPTTFAGLKAFAASLKPGQDPYNKFFCKFDDPNGGERKIVLLPDGTPVPYVHAGWGDGGYPVFTLTDTQGTICAIFADFMGCDQNGKWLTPPGVTLE